MAKPIYGDLQLKGQNKIQWADADSSNVVSLSSPATVTSDLDLVLPSTDTANGALVSNGSGALSLALIANANIDAGASIDQSKLNLSITNSEINASAAIAFSKMENLTTARALVSDGSGDVSVSAVTSTELGHVSGVTSAIQTQLDAKLALAGGTMTGAIAMGSNQITGLAAGSLATDAVNKGQLDAAVAGLTWKEACRAASTADVTVSAPGSSIDGVTLSNGDRVLLKDQSTGSENGIYEFNGAASAMTRASDMDGGSEADGAAVFVTEGTANADKGFNQTTDSVTIGTTSQTWVQFTGGGALSGGDGIDITGSTVSVDHDGEGLTFSVGQLILELDGTTLSKSGTGVKVADGGLTNTQINASAAIAESKLALDQSTADLLLKAGDTMTGNLTMNARSEVRYADTDSSNYVALRSPSVVGSNVTFDLPGSDTANGAMVSNGSGALSLALIANANVDGSAAIAESKLALDQSTADLAQRDLDNLTVASLAAESLLVGSSSSAVVALAAGSEGQVLKISGGSVAWANDSGAASFQADWITADGTSKVVTHSLGTKDVMVQIYDKATDETIEVDSVVRTSTSAITLTASEAPNASGWRVIILDVS